MGNVCSSHRIYICDSFKRKNAPEISYKIVPPVFANWNIYENIRISIKS